MVRTPCYDKNGMKKGAWSAEEDDKLRAYVQRYGHWNWRQLPKFAGLSRCGKSCRLRWMNYLKPNVKRGNYSKEEEDIIMKLHDQIGTKWSAMAAKLPGRTDNEIKNHWHTHLKKRVKQNPAATSEGNLLKEQSTKTFQCDSENIAGDADPSNQQTSESSQLSPESFCSEISSLSSDCAASGAINWAAADSMPLLESFQDSIGNFWTEPFLADTSCHQNDFSSSLVEEGFISYFLSQDDGVDLFY